jgi:IS5 family transposase
MEHIGNYLDKYRHMIAEHDAQKQIFSVVDSLQVALTEQGRQIKQLEDVCRTAQKVIDDELKALNERIAQYENDKH